MRKLALMPALFVIACVFAGLYGALHNQISYTVSPEYFTAFKFHQFHILNIPPRLGAAMVGWLAAWWMVIVIGIILIPLGCIIPRPVDYFYSMIRVFGVVILTTLIVGLVSLTAAYFMVDANTFGEIKIYGNDVIDDAAFARAGVMHDCSYLGGLLGVITGGVAIFRCRKDFLNRGESVSPLE